MDILYHICILFALGFLFFLYKYLVVESKSKVVYSVPMLFISLISSIGFIILSKSSTYITTGYNTSVFRDVDLRITNTITVPIQEAFSYDWALYLAYFGFFVLAVYTLTVTDSTNVEKN